ncbi:MAG: hypothetical protein ACYCX4_05315 [Bacillota bacterium]
MVSIETDREGTPFELRDSGEYMAPDYWLRAGALKGPSRLNLLTVDAGVKTCLLFMRDGREWGRTLVNAGITHLTLNVEYDRGLNIYARTYETEGVASFWRNLTLYYCAG